MKTEIILTKKINPKNPILLVGLPGVGSVGRLVAKQIIRETKAERFATLNSEHFPPQVVMQKNGKLRFENMRFYYIKNREKGKNDIIVLTGDDQPMPTGQYIISNMILDFFVDKLGGKFIYTIGGYNSVEAYNNIKLQHARVFGNASNSKVISMFKSSDVLFGESRGMIFGAAGMIVAAAKARNIPAICLMGESRSIDRDPLAAKSVINVLTKSLGIKIGTKEIEDMINNVTEAINKMESEVNANIQMPQLPTAGSPNPNPNERYSYIR
ncbi:MAG: PAC2 family protein [Candidatus Marsarchaeota archaeon]|nr:PAC2 family protein [Candidatus Marsarchaeota archaeon]